MAVGEAADGEDNGSVVDVAAKTEKDVRFGGPYIKARVGTT